MWPVVIHHSTACPGWFCPFKALAPHVNSIVPQGCPITTPLSFVRPGIHIVASNVTNLVHQAVRNTKIVTQQGYDLQHVSTHSL